MIRTAELLDLDKTIASALFEGREYPWEVLGDVEAFIRRLGPQLPPEDFDHPAADVWLAKDAIVSAAAHIDGPCIVDHAAEIRPCAAIRGSAIVGKQAVVGNFTELKNVVLFDRVQVPHHNYVGDSILGYEAHMGAGSMTCNVKSDKTPVSVKDADGARETGRWKLGAILGNRVEVGGNTVLNPGTVIGANTSVYPLCSVRGVVPANSIYKGADCIVPKR